MRDQTWPASRLRQGTHIVSSIMHRIMSFLAGWFAVYLTYLVIFLFYYFSHFFWALVLLLLAEPHAFAYMQAYLIGNSKRRHRGYPGWVPGMGKRPGGDSHEPSSSQNYFDGKERREEAWGCRVMGGNIYFPQLQHPGTPLVNREYPRSVWSAA